MSQTLQLDYMHRMSFSLTLEVTQFIDLNRYIRLLILLFERTLRPYLWINLLQIF